LSLITKNWIGAHFALLSDKQVLVWMLLSGWFSLSWRLTRVVTGFKGASGRRQGLLNDADLPLAG
jgi:hypothetical protein